MGGTFVFMPWWLFVRKCEVKCENFKFGRNFWALSLHVGQRGTGLQSSSFPHHQPVKTGPNCIKVCG